MSNDVISETAQRTGDEPQPEVTGAAPGAAAEPEFVEDELLVEEVSIDGMCGVY